MSAWSQKLKATRSFFVTGIDTGIGKTFVVEGLLHAAKRAGLSAAGMKPVASGASKPSEGERLVNEDALALQKAATLPLTLEEVNPCVFAPPISPHFAAREANIRIDLERLIEARRALRLKVDLLLVEGVGGWRVPLSSEDLLSDLARRMNDPVILIVGLRLGCINHALLSAEAIQRDGVGFAGWIGNQIDADYSRIEETLETLDKRIPAPRLCPALPWRGAPGAEREIEDHFGIALQRLLKR